MIDTIDMIDMIGMIGLIDRKGYCLYIYMEPEYTSCCCSRSWTGDGKVFYPAGKMEDPCSNDLSNTMLQSVQKCVYVCAHMSMCIQIFAC